MFKISLRIMAVAFIAIVFSAPCFSKNLEANASNCRKVTAVSQNFLENAAAYYRTSVSSITFLRMDAESDCIAIIDTPKGPKKCAFTVIGKQGQVYIGHTNNTGGVVGCLGSHDY